MNILKSYKNKGMTHSTESATEGNVTVIIQKLKLFLLLDIFDNQRCFVSDSTKRQCSLERRRRDFSKDGMDKSIQIPSLRRVN